jgi:hypothetical protein
MLKLVLLSLVALATLTNVVLAPIEARTVREGRNVRSFFYILPTRKNLDRPHEEFVAIYRRALKSMGWPWVVIGVIQLTLLATFILFGWTAVAAWALVIGCFFLLTGLTSVRCRRILDFPAISNTDLRIPGDEGTK